MTRIGDLVATLAPVAGYDAGGAARVRIISQEGPAVTVSIEHLTYTVAEDAGTLDVVVVARAHSSVPRVDGFNVAVLTDSETASQDPNTGDYLGLSSQLRFNSSDFQMENGALVGRRTVSVTILDDDIHEDDEIFHLHLGKGLGNNWSETTLVDPQGEVCSDECPNPYVVTITDNDPAVTVQFGQNAYTVVEGGTQDVTVTLSDDPQRTVVIPITITDQDGATGDDYSGVPTSVTFNAGETSSTFTLTATDDTIVDDGESVKLSFDPTLPPGVTEGAINETVVTITERKIADTERPGISIPRCEANGVLMFWQAATALDSDPPPHGWRVERRHWSNEEWITARFDFLGAEAHALQTYSDEYWDWTDSTRQFGVDYTYRAHALDSDGELMEGRVWSRRAEALCR